MNSFVGEHMNSFLRVGSQEHATKISFLLLTMQYLRVLFQSHSHLDRLVFQFQALPQYQTFHVFVVPPYLFLNLQYLNYYQQLMQLQNQYPKLQLETQPKLFFQLLHYTVALRCVVGRHNILDQTVMPRLSDSLFLVLYVKSSSKFLQNKVKIIIICHSIYLILTYLMKHSRRVFRILSNI